jgi:hypothetical protein
MTFDEWFVKYPLPAEIDTMDDTDREQWTWALRSAYKTGAASTREWVGLTDEEIEQGCKESWVTLQAWQSAVWWAEAKLKEKNT